MKTDRFGPLGALVLGLAAAACGGGDDLGDPAAALAARAAPPALFDDQGQPAPAARMAAHPGLQTRAGLYASAAQYAWEALTVEPYTVLVDVEALGGVDGAIRKTLADAGWSADSARAAFYVRSAHGDQAVRVADALHAAGLPLVFLITGAGA